MTDLILRTFAVLGLWATFFAEGCNATVAGG